MVYLICGPLSGPHQPPLLLHGLRGGGARRVRGVIQLAGTKILLIQEKCGKMHKLILLSFSGRPHHLLRLLLLLFGGDQLAGDVHEHRAESGEPGFFLVGKHSRFPTYLQKFKTLLILKKKIQNDMKKMLTAAKEEWRNVKASWKEERRKITRKFISELLYNGNSNISKAFYPYTQRRNLSCWRSRKKGK